MVVLCARDRFLAQQIPVNGSPPTTRLLVDDKSVSNRTPLLVGRLAAVSLCSRSSTESSDWPVIISLFADNPWNLCGD